MAIYTLYHVSLIENESSIVEYGLDPAFSRGARPVLWFAEKKAVAWAVTHVSKIHHLPTDELMVWRVICDTQELRRTNMPCIYTCGSKMKPYSPQSVLEFFTPLVSNLWFPEGNKNERQNVWPNTD